MLDLKIIENREQREKNGENTWQFSKADMSSYVFENSEFFNLKTMFFAINQWPLTEINAHAKRWTANGILLCFTHTLSKYWVSLVFPGSKKLNISYVLELNCMRKENIGKNIFRARTAEKKAFATLWFVEFFNFHFNKLLVSVKWTHRKRKNPTLMTRSQAITIEAHWEQIHCWFYFLRVAK